MPKGRRAQGEQIRKLLGPSRKGMERRLDSLLYRIVSIRDRNRCRKCEAVPRKVIHKKGRYAGQERTQALAPHHVFSRVYRQARWDENNVVLLCSACHAYFGHTRYEEFRDWIIKEIGEDAFLRLKYRALSRGRVDLSAMEMYLSERIEFWRRWAGAIAVVAEPEKAVRGVSVLW